MGVHGLWDLLAPVGRRVSVETLAGKRLAIDASIWMVQFMKAMRDDKGEMVRNAHLLGFFRRICKLLFLRTKPVFVFDGGTPALKRRTVIARRRQRENALAKVRKTAEKLFLNQVKAMRLSKLAENLKDQKNMGKSKGKEAMVEQSDMMEKSNAVSSIENQKILDEMLAASLIAEECGGFGSTASTPFTSTSSAAFVTEGEDSDNDDETIVPITDGNVDPAVLAALPPSMQLDLLVQMREKLMAENRQKYQKVKKAPQKFSELQIEAYLKTVAFRREIDQVQKAASGRGVGGVQTSRIASEANREFIFSSSFSGDKQVLASSGVEKISEKQEQLGNKETPSDIVDVIASSGSIADSEAGPEANEVETYLDEKGRKRIHRNRAMGIRMTRDLQRNIDLMKESEHGITTANKKLIKQTEHDPDFDPDKFVCGDHSSPQKPMLKSEISKDALKMESSIKITLIDDGKPTTVDDDDTFFTRLVAGSPLSVCSGDNSGSEIEWEDGTGDKRSNSLGDRNKLETNSSHGEDINKSESDVEWEEGPIIADSKLEAYKFHLNNREGNEIRVERQEAYTKNLGEVQQIKTDIPKAVSKGSVEEESALQEAIRRSLGDFTGETTNNLSLDLQESRKGSKIMGETLIGTELPRPFASENDQSNVLSVNNTSAPSTSYKNSESEIGDASKTFITISDDIKNLHFQQPKTCTENAGNSNFCSDGSDVLTVTTSGALSSSLLVPRKEDNTNEEVTTGTSDMTIGHETPVTGLPTFHADIQRKADEDDTILVSVLESGRDVQINHPHDDKDISNDLFGARLEDELLLLGKEYKDLENEQKKLERNADSVNSEMFVECQELLQMFGLPYIIAPMEAEAQCAFLELANLVDGVVTDDSDVFLFGARHVFKNIFDDRKYVETYLLKDVESELGLDTEKLIRMALLLGSDYTEGVSGIGIVNAIEVVNAFPEDDGLHQFREWVESPDPTIIGKVGLQTLSPKKNGLKGTSTSDWYTSEEIEDDVATDRRRKQLFMNKHRNVSKNWHLPALFPSDAVISAYKSPQVDKSAEPFSWGKPDLFSLRRLCSEKFSWANQKADELLLPVLKEYNKHETQLRLEAFYSFNEKFANIRSKRIRQAVKGITGKQSLANTDGLQELPKQVKKRGENTSIKSNTKKSDDIEKKKNSSKSSKSKSKSKKRETEGTEVDGTGCSTERGSSSSVKRSIGMQNSDSELDESNIYNRSGSSDENELVREPEKATLSCTVRRSKRIRRPTSYVERDDETDEPTKSPARTIQNSTNDKTGQHKSFEFQDVLKIDMIEARRQKQKTSDVAELSGAYLVKSGGFCADEDDQELKTDTEGPIHSEVFTFDNDGEYLQMGGGFCTDDAEHLDFQDGAQELPYGPSSVSISNPSEEHKSTDVNPSSLAAIVGDCGTPASVTAVSAFSAIPYLKRKKKKV